MHELPDLSGLSMAGKDALILALFGQVKQVERLTAMVQALSARLRWLHTATTPLQKTSGCFRTVTGAESFCTVTGAQSSCAIRSYLAALRKQRRNVVHALTLAFQGQARNPLPSG